MRAAWARALTTTTTARVSHLFRRRSSGGDFPFAAASASTSSSFPRATGLERSRRSVWTGAGGPDRGDGSRVGRHDERPPPPPVCQRCHRRFCQCEDKPPSKPPFPGPEDCCQSAPQCKFCVWKVYEQQLREYEAFMRNNEGGGGGSAH